MKNEKKRGRGRKRKHKEKLAVFPLNRKKSNPAIYVSRSRAAMEEQEENDDETHYNRIKA